MLKKKPKIGDKVITGDPDCCWGGHKEGSLGVIVARDNLKDWGGLVKVGKRSWWHCRKCLSLPPNTARTRLSPRDGKLPAKKSNRKGSAPAKSG